MPGPMFAFLACASFLKGGQTTLNVMLERPSNRSLGGFDEPLTVGTLKNPSNEEYPNIAGFRTYHQKTVKP